MRPAPGPTSPTIGHKVLAINVTGIQPGKFASNLGTAHELLVTGILMRWGFDVSVSSVKGGPYDLLITAYEDGPGTQHKVIRAQTKTCGREGSLRFVGGVRGGVDRAYTSTTKRLVNKSYVYSEKDNDLIIGVDQHNLDLYLIPTLLIAHIGKSSSLRRLLPLKNRWEILLNWRPNYLTALLQELLAGTVLHRRSPHKQRDQEGATSA